MPLQTILSVAGAAAGHAATALHLSAPLKKPSESSSETPKPAAENRHPHRHQHHNDQNPPQTPTSTPTIQQANAPPGPHPPNLQKITDMVIAKYWTPPPTQYVMPQPPRSWLEKQYEYQNGKSEYQRLLRNQAQQEEKDETDEGYASGSDGEEDDEGYISDSGELYRYLPLEVEDWEWEIWVIEADFRIKEEEEFLRSLRAGRRVPWRKGEFWKWVDGICRSVKV